MYLGIDFTRMEVQHEQTLEYDTTMLDPAREDNQHHHHKTNRDHERIGETAEVVTDIEDKANGNHHAHDNGKDQRQAVTVRLIPEGLIFITVILLHDHGTKEGGYKDYSEQARNGIGIPMKLPTWQQLTCKRQHKRKHHGDASRREDTVNQGIDSHLRQ